MMRPYQGRDIKRDEFQDRVLDLRRVARVTAGGKRLRFRATVIIGDGKGRVGVGIGKGLDVQLAVQKGKTEARKNIIRVPTKGRTIPHEVEAKFSAAHVRLKPAKEGHGLVAGGAVRVVLLLAGIKDCTGKCLGRTPNKLTNALATIEALKQLKPAKSSAKGGSPPNADAPQEHASGEKEQMAKGETIRHTP